MNNGVLRYLNPSSRRTNSLITVIKALLIKYVVFIHNARYNSLTAIAEQGPDAFYKGWIADRIAEDMAANKGLITKQDLANYVAKERAPIKGSFNGYDIVSMPPPSSRHAPVSAGRQHTARMV